MILEDKTRKMVIGDTEYTFKMVNRTILKIEKKYGNYGLIIDGLMKGIEFMTNSIKLLSCCCLERTFEVEELIDLLTPQQLNNEIPSFVTNLYFDYMGINDTKNDKEKRTRKNRTEKN